MARIATFAITSRSPATAVLRLSPDRAGISGSAQLPSGAPVPIADLLTRVLAQYGLPESGTKNRPKDANANGREVQLDLWA